MALDKYDITDYLYMNDSPLSYCMSIKVHKDAVYFNFSFLNLAYTQLL